MPGGGNGGSGKEGGRRLDALAVELLVGLGAGDAAERRAGELLQIMATGERPDDGLQRDTLVALADLDDAVAPASENVSGAGVRAAG